MDQKLERLELLIKEEGLNKLKKAKVLVVGVGGVGGYAIEALARSGLKEIYIMDNDVVSITNLNRQIIATYDTIGVSKCEAMKQRVATFSDTKIVPIQEFYSEDTNVIDETFDYVIDACDTLSAKVAIVEHCHKYHVPCICSLGMANRLDPSKIYQTTLDKTSGDPLARAFRQVVRKKGIKYPIQVIMSSEEPMKQNKLVNPEGLTLKEKYPPASCAFVPSACGLYLASIVVRSIINA